MSPRRPTLLIWLVSVIAISAGLVAPAAAQSAQPALDVDAVDRFVRSEMREHRIPGLALAVVDNGHLALANGYGTAGHDRPMSPDTPMFIGSVSKSFTALAAMQLVEQGRLDLDAPVQRYLPWFRVADEQAAAAITVRHLLTHTSGLSRAGYRERSLPPDASMTDLGRDLASATPSAPVGSTFQYFNPNYTVAGLVIEQVSGQPFEAYVQQHILGPLGMSRTFLNPADATRAGLASGHSSLFGYPLPREQPFYRYELPSGSILSSARDMSRYLMALLSGGSPVLSPAGVAALVTPTPGVTGVFTSGTRMDETSRYGLGWGVDVDHGVRVVHHSGGEDFFVGEVVLLPDQGRGVVVLMNQRHLFTDLFVFQRLTSGILDLLEGRAPTVGGPSVRLVGWITLGVFLVVAAVVTRSALRLRGWAGRARSRSRARLVRDIATEFLVPMLLVAVVYLGVSMSYGQAPGLRGFLTGGLINMPDLLLILVVATVPGILQGVYKTVVVAVHGSRPRRVGDQVAGGPD